MRMSVARVRVHPAPVDVSDLELQTKAQTEAQTKAQTEAQSRP